MYVGNNPIYFIDPDGNGSNPFDIRMPNIGESFDKAVATASWAIETFANHSMAVLSLGQKENVEQVAKTAIVVAENVAEHGAPDMVSLYAFAETAYSLGSYNEFGANWITNGPESSFLPYSNYTGGATGGWGIAGVGIGLRLGWSFEDKPSMSSYYGFGSTIAGGAGLGGASVSGDLSLSYSSQGVSWMTTSMGLGFGLPGAGGYGSETYTVPIGKSRLEN